MVMVVSLVVVAVLVAVEDDGHGCGVSNYSLYAVLTELL
jgi:hypothetical protein